LFPLFFTPLCLDFPPLFFLPPQLWHPNALPFSPPYFEKDNFRSGSFFPRFPVRLILFPRRGLVFVSFEDVPSHDTSCQLLFSRPFPPQSYPSIAAFKSQALHDSFTLPRLRAHSFPGPHPSPFPFFFFQRFFRVLKYFFERFFWGLPPFFFFPSPCPWTFSLWRYGAPPSFNLFCEHFLFFRPFFSFAVPSSLSSHSIFRLLSHSFTASSTPRPRGSFKKPPSSPGLYPSPSPGFLKVSAVHHFPFHFFKF